MKVNINLSNFDKNILTFNFCGVILHSDERARDYLNR